MDFDPRNFPLALPIQFRLGLPCQSVTTAPAGLAAAAGAGAAVGGLGIAALARAIDRHGKNSEGSHTASLVSFD